MPITMSLTEAGSTKALLDKTTFETTGNQIKIYDYYTDGSIATGYYIDDVIQCATPGNWPFVEEKYKWTTDGVHNFFGWLIKDNYANPAVTATDLFGNEFKFEDKVLKIPPTTLGQDTPQFDFMYSDIHPRDLNHNPYFTEVPLNFSHLFTAFKVTAANKSSNDVYLKKVSIVGLKNKRSATIDYNGSVPVLSIIDAANPMASNFEYADFSGYTIDANGGGVKLTSSPINVSPNGEYAIMWPQSEADFADASIVVEYNYKEKNSANLQTDGKTTVSAAVLKPWLAGYKNGLALTFNDRTVTLNCIVEPWNKSTDNIDFTDQVSASKPIRWVSGTYYSLSEENGIVVLNPELTAVCNFHIDTPRGATWTATLIPVEGATDAFIIEDGTNHGVVGVDSQIAIRINRIDGTVQSRSRAILRIMVETADGRSIKADLMPEETDENVTEYTIIQNLING